MTFEQRPEGEKLCRDVGEEQPGKGSDLKCLRDSREGTGGLTDSTGERGRGGDRVRGQHQGLGDLATEECGMRPPDFSGRGSSCCSVESRHGSRMKQDDGERLLLPHR